MTDAVKAQTVVSDMAAAVAAMTTASSSAETLLTQTSAHIQSITDTVEPTDEETVNNALDQLEDFCGELNSRAAELAAAVVANTPADPTNAGAGAGATPSGGDSSSAGDSTLDPHSIEGAAAAGGFNVTDGSAPPADANADNTPPPAAGQHPDAPVEQPSNSTLTEAENNSGNENADGSSADKPVGEPGNGDASARTLPDQSSGSSDGSGGVGSDQSAGSGDGSAPVGGDTVSGDDASQQPESGDGA